MNCLQEMNRIIVTDFNYPSSSTIKFSVQFNEVCFLSSCLLELKTKLFKKKIGVNIENFKNMQRKLKTSTEAK